MKSKPKFKEITKMGIVPQNKEFTDFGKRHLLFDRLDEIGQKLEPTKAEREKAKNCYNAVGDWLRQSDIPLLQTSKINLIGSIASETGVRPLGKDEFDVDLNCHLNVGIDSGLEPEEVKNLIGSRLKENLTYKSMLDEKWRCWRLNYSGNFHLDIAPTINHIHGHGGEELIPDKELSIWQITNPSGFIELFKSRAAKEPTYFSIEEFNKTITASQEPFPKYRKYKGILIRVVQLLKRHRDIYFLSKSKKLKPSSIILSTLAMQSYEYCVENQVFFDEWDVFVSTIQNMPKFIEIIDGQYCIPNETTENENFAELWNKKPGLKLAFDQWHNATVTYFYELLVMKGNDLITSSLKKNFGEREVGQVIADEHSKLGHVRDLGKLGIAPLGGLTLNSAKSRDYVPKNVFDGD